MLLAIHLTDEGWSIKYSDIGIDFGTNCAGVKVYIREHETPTFAGTRRLQKGITEKK